MRTTADVAYLGPNEGPEGLGAVRYVALYKSEEPGRGRAVYTLLLPAQQRCMVVVVQPSILAAREVTVGTLQSAWREVMGVLADQGHNSQEQVGKGNKRCSQGSDGL